MATDNFLDKKSVLGLAERVPMCPPPETIVFADSIQWLGSSQIEGNQHQYAENISTANITNYGLLRQLAIGQSIACQIKINGGREVLPLFLVSNTNSLTGTYRIYTYITKGTTVLNDGKIAGVIFEYIYRMLQSVGVPTITETLNCHVYIHDWETL